MNRTDGMFVRSNGVEYPVLKLKDNHRMMVLPEVNTYQVEDLTSIVAEVGEGATLLLVAGVALENSRSHYLDGGVPDIAVELLSGIYLHGNEQDRAMRNLRDLVDKGRVIIVPEVEKL